MTDFAALLTAVSCTEGLLAAVAAGLVVHGNLTVTLRKRPRAEGRCQVTVTISVTRDDLDHGDHCGGTCPVARAIKRALSLPAVHVGRSQWWPYDDRQPDMSEALQLPRAARMFLSEFDEGCAASGVCASADHWDVEPFSFDLDVPGDLLAGAV